MSSKLPRNMQPEEMCCKAHPTSVWEGVLHSDTQASGEHFLRTDNAEALL